ncbi:pyrroline-5-carboxylate reductase [ANME-2 cluster archaeon]|nr:pyrroline-5-carboxylate reductase [Methanosarcinales archaeon]RJS73504.1 MAG: pyrroline-5-carboxylate reductase [ANME-2 cluster archaeon]
MKIGFVGAGRIGEALIRGVLAADLTQNDQIFAGDVDADRLNALSKELGINTSTDNNDVVNNAEVIILAVKPQIISAVLQTIKPRITREHIIISVAAGVPIRAIEENLPDGAHLIRVMPNIACTVRQAISAICAGSYATGSDEETARIILGSVGRVVTVPESMMDAVTGLSGSGPAFVSVIIEAMADGGVHEGLPRDIALELAAQTVLGAAAMILETRSHPGALKDMVTSPAGTTIRGIRALEEHGLRAAMMDAVIAATRRSRELGESNI